MKRRSAMVAIFLSAFLSGCGDGASKSSDKAAGTATSGSANTIELPPPTPKERRLEENAKRAAAANHLYLSTTELERHIRWVAELEATGDASRQILPKSALAQFAIGAGKLDIAVKHLEDAIRLFPDAKIYPEPVLTNLKFDLAIAHFRIAERENCIARHNEDSCLFPLKGGALHVFKDGAQRSKAVLIDLIATAPEMREAEWILNVAHMALGTYPEGVPAAHRLPPERLRAAEDLPRMIDVAPTVGTNFSSRAGSAIAEDMDGDDRPDIVTGSFDPKIPMRYLRNRGDGKFVDLAEKFWLSRQLGAAHIAVGDVSGDGKKDLFVVRGAELGTEGAWPCSLLVQRQDGGFDDLTEAAGLSCDAPSRSSTMADIDLDGDLDLFVGYQTTTDPATNKRVFESRLYRNDGRGKFENVTAAAGIANDRYVAGAVFADVDGDRYPDLFISNRFAPNRLYRNRGDGTFEDVTEAAGVAAPEASTSASFADVDQDGDLDLFVAVHEDQMHGRAVAEFHWTGKITGACSVLFENDGKGRFTDATKKFALERPDYVLGAAFGDIDRDGFPDLYLGTGSDEMAALWPNVLLRNKDGRAFGDATGSADVGHLQKTNSISFADFDADGDQDIFLEMGGFMPDDAFADVLFANPCERNASISVALEGRRSNRAAIGARVRVRVATPVGPRDRFAFVGHLSSAGGSGLSAFVGLGDGTEILELGILWPTAGSTEEIIREVPLRRTVRIRESSGRAEPLSIAPFVMRR